MTIKQAIYYIFQKLGIIEAALSDFMRWNNVIISEVTVPANSTYTNTSVDISAGTPSGYKPVFAICSGTGNANITCYQSRLGAGNVGVIQLRNWTSGALTVRPVFSIIYVKDI